MSVTDTEHSSHSHALDAAWGRARYTEAEIKKAFEVAEKEASKLEAEAEKLKANDNSSDMKKKRRQQEKQRRAELKKKEGNPTIRKLNKSTKKQGTTNTSDGDLGEMLTGAREDEEWNAFITTATQFETSDLSDMTEEQKKVQSFEEWGALDDNNVSDASLLTYDPFRQQQEQEERKSVNLPAAALTLIFMYLGPSEIPRLASVCRYWREIAKSKQVWRAIFHRMEASLFADSKEIPLWEELGTDFTTVVTQTKDINSMSLSRLVATLTPQKDVLDMMDLNTFVTTYQTFTTTKLLVKKLIERYNVPELPHTATDEAAKEHIMQIVRPIQMRVCKILKMVIETHQIDIESSGILPMLRVFANALVENALLQKQLLTALTTIKKTNMNKSMEIDIATKKLSMMGDIFELSSEELAKQLTLAEFEIYSAIKPAEFFDQAWAKPKYHHRAPNIRALIDRFNHITRWIVTEVLKEEKMRGRVKKMIKFIKVAECLRSLHNFHTLMAILSGLDEGPLYRLKFTRAELPVKYKESFDNLKALMSADKSYGAYRSELHHAEPPCTPYIGIYLRDLTYFDEGGGGDDGLINFKNRKNVYSVIQIIQKYQERPYNFKKNEKAYNFLKSINGWDTEQAFGVSNEREPRNCKRQDLE